MQDYDVIVIGAGAAGLTAAMFAGRYGLRVLVVDERSAGGQYINAERIENVPGFPDGIAGFELMPRLQEQAVAAGAELQLDRIERVEMQGRDRVVRTSEGNLSAGAVIVAAGSTMRLLGVPGEQEFTGRGVSHCASCDGLFFSGSEVAVIGGGDSALDEALVLSGMASKVAVFQDGNSLTAQQVLVDRLKRANNVEVVLNARVEEIVGDGMVSGVKVQVAGAEEAALHPLSGVFIYVGLEPSTAFLQDIVKLDSGGHIETDIAMATSVPGIFAAGDIRSRSVAQIATAVGDGATAAISAYRYLKSSRRAG